jgi:hypothetical protein
VERADQQQAAVTSQPNAWKARRPVDGGLFCARRSSRLIQIIAAGIRLRLFWVRSTGTGWHLPP